MSSRQQQPLPAGLSDTDSIKSLTRDLKKATSTLSPREARYLVDMFYAIQKLRISSGNQVRAMTGSKEPHEVISWFSGNAAVLEKQIERALGAFAMTHKVGEWCMEKVFGLGPVMTAGLIAFIDIEKANVPGKIYGFAGLNPKAVWLGREKSKDLVNQIVKDASEVEKNNLRLLIPRIALAASRKPESLSRFVEQEVQRRMEKAKEKKAQDAGEVTDEEKSVTEEVEDTLGITKSDLISAVARRPWNAKFRTLTWKIGRSFLKFKGFEDCFYGKLLAERWEWEKQQNEAGLYVEVARKKLQDFDIGKSTQAYAAYSQGKLPPGHILQRACRWSVKLFLSHYHEVAFESRFGHKPVQPYVFAYLGHTDRIPVPNWPLEG
jgi:hypothetical protein